MPFTAQDVVDRAALLLTDVAGTHWPQTTLVQFVDDGVSALASALPHEFSEPTTITLSPTAEQVVPSPYVDVTEIIGVVDTNGDVQLYDWEYSRSRVNARLRGKYSCSGSGVPSPDLFKVVGTTRGVFTVDPAPSAAVDVRVIAVREPPVISALTDTVPLGREFLHMLVDYVVMRAYEQDLESDVARTEASRFRDKFWTEVNANYAAASRMRSRYVLSMEGDEGAHQSPVKFNERRVFG